MDKTILITGAGKGLGRAIGDHFRTHGWQIIATDVTADLLADLSAREGWFPVVMDVSDEESVKRAFGQIREQVSAIDLIVNNAGIDRYFPLSEAPAEYFKMMFEVNVFGAYRVNQTFLPLLRKPGGGILAIGSESLYLTLPFMAYPITKRTLENYIFALRHELWYSGCWASVVRCGPMKTSIAENVFHLRSEVRSTLLDPVFERFAGMAPKQVGKMIDPGIAARIIFRISSKKRPAALYKINNRLSLRMMKWIPACITEKAVRMMLADRNR